jgi:SnoaL-like domain
MANDDAPPAVTGYFEADARRDVEGVVALFTPEGVVEDEDETWRGTARIRAWREGPASRYRYTTELFDTTHTGGGQYVVSGRLTGNFPGGTADLTWRFTLEGDRISRLHIG